MKVALNRANRCIVVRHGAVQLEGPACSLRDDPAAVHDAYFGRVFPG